MSRTTYKGRVRTVQEAMWAEMPVVIVCQNCDHETRRHAWLVVQARPDMATLPLACRLSGFFCTRCRASVQVMIWAGTPPRRPEQFWTKEGPIAFIGAGRCRCGAEAMRIQGGAACCDRCGPPDQDDEIPDGWTPPKKKKPRRRKAGRASQQWG